MHGCGVCAKSRHFAFFLSTKTSDFLCTVYTLIQTKNKDVRHVFQKIRNFLRFCTRSHSAEWNVYCLRVSFCCLGKPQMRGAKNQKLAKWRPSKPFQSWLYGRFTLGKGFFNLFTTLPPILNELWPTNQTAKIITEGVLSGRHCWHQILNIVLRILQSLYWTCWCKHFEIQEDKEFELQSSLSQKISNKLKW